MLVRGVAKIEKENRKKGEKTVIVDVVGDRACRASCS